MENASCCLKVPNVLFIFYETITDKPPRDQRSLNTLDFDNPQKTLAAFASTVQPENVVDNHVK